MDFNELLQQLGGQFAVFLPVVGILVGLFVAWVVLIFLKLQLLVAASA